MNIKKVITGMIGTIALTAVAATAAMAQLTPIASVTTGTSNNTTFTSSSTGDSLVVTYPDGTFVGKVGNGSFLNTLVNFSATGGSTTAFNSVTGAFTETFTGGTFSVYNGATDLLSGTFSGGTIQGTVGDQSGGLNVTGVTYDAASTALPSTYNPNGGTISLTYNVILPGGYAVSGGKLQGFTATDSGVYSAVKNTTTVPEPATVVPFMLGGLGLLGLIVRKTRRTSGMAA
jgi:hypothetical protein